MTYVQQVWADNDASKPVSAARMNHIENGLVAAVAVESNGDVKIGPNLGFLTSVSASYTDLQPVDFFWDYTHRRLFLRTIIARENGDTAELALQRSEGTYPDGAPAALGDGVAIGLVHWTPHDGTGFQHRSGQIYVRTAGAATPTNAGGNLYFGTTAQGGVASPIDRLTIRQSGAVLIVSGNLSEAQGDALGARGDLIVGGKVYATGRLVAVTGLSVGNTAAASTPGTVVKKMQVFDETGSSLGYVPIYNAIT